MFMECDERRATSVVVGFGGNSLYEETVNALRNTSDAVRVSKLSDAQISNNLHELAGGIALAGREFAGKQVASMPTPGQQTSTQQGQVL